MSVRIAQLLTGKLPARKDIDPETIRKQRLAAAMACQIIEEYPRQAGKDWSIYRHIRGVMLADEVGGGKTFEALAVVARTFLNATKRSPKKRFRVLILAAPAIRSKWEWVGDPLPDPGAAGKQQDRCDLERFIQQTRISPRDAARLRKFFATARGGNVVTSSKRWADVFGRPRQQGIYITGFGTLPKTRGSGRKARFVQGGRKFTGNFFDLIIADEAHAVKSGHKEDERSNDKAISNTAVRKIHALMESQPRARLLMLTATPFQNHIKELIHLITLNEKHHAEDVSLAKILDKGLHRMQHEVDRLVSKQGMDIGSVEALQRKFDHDINLLLADDPNIAKVSRPAPLRINGNRNGLDDLLRDIMVRNSKRKLPQQLVELNLTEPQRLEYLLARDLVPLIDEDSGKGMYQVRLSQLVSSQDSFTARLSRSRKARFERLQEAISGERSFFNAKLDALVRLLQQEKPDKKRVVTVFCRFIPTIQWLEAKLKERYPADHIRRLDGATRVKDRKPVLLELEELNHRKSKLPIVFLVSQVGNEGLDFDRFSDTIIHFDGHYNPAVMDQRNGRIYRGENLQDIDRLRVLQFVYKDTYDERIKFIEHSKSKLKDFYLGDGALDQVYQRAADMAVDEENRFLKALEKVRIDLSARKRNLVGRYKWEV